MNWFGLIWFKNVGSKPIQWRVSKNNRDLNERIIVDVLQFQVRGEFIKKTKKSNKKE